jgi:aldehyde dehydrogenase (NAD+)
MSPTATLETIHTTIPEIETIFNAQQAFFTSGVTRSFEFRKGQLQVLKQAVKRHENAILNALRKDLGKPAFEGYETEVGLLYEEISYFTKHLKQWMIPKRVATPITLFPSTSKVYPQALGTVFIICPWNYPFYLMMMPLVAAIAAGNTVILKPSEIATETEIVINTIINETFEQEYIATVDISGPAVSEIIRTHHFDHVFFTGSTQVGSKIMEAAARQLTPVTLELGGKSPCIVSEDAALDFAAKKIAWSKFINAGQICVAPDYLLVHESVKDKLLEKIVAAIKKMYGDNPQLSVDYGRIINDKRWETVNSYLQEGEIYFGGQSDRADRYISPTIITGISSDSVLMQEEIFGPVLPVITYKNRDEVLGWVEKNPYPLACYIYTQNRHSERFYIENIRFGGGAVNNGLVHLGNTNLPFSGVGYSGIGAYHGKAGFDAFTHYKSMVKTPKWFDMPIIYPPYKNNLKWLKKIIK